MADKPWMIYGAYGYTGSLIAEEAVRRGHRPVLAGRLVDRLAPLAKRLGLDFLTLGLEDQTALPGVMAAFGLVFHAAGPFVHTSRPMVRACLEAGVHYLDLCGEFAVLEENLSHHEEARRKGIALISGAGYSVIASDCLARYVSDRVPGANDLSLAVSGLDRMSPGTVKTVLEQMPSGTFVRRNAHLMTVPAGKGSIRVRFGDGERSVVPASLGDLVTAARSTGIPNITAYMAFPEMAIRMMRLTGPVTQVALAITPLRRLVQMGVGMALRGPDEAARQSGRCRLWARASSWKRSEAVAWLETAEAYQFTMVAAVRCVERVLERPPLGALTPSQAFGADFVLEIPGTKRYDALP